MSVFLIETVFTDTREGDCRLDKQHIVTSVVMEVATGIKK